MNKISLIDYGIGNILSVQRAFEYWDAQVEFVDTPDKLLLADHLVLPGVGAFKDGMLELQKRNLVGAIREYCSYDKPFLGICLGMQMMLDESEEFGITEGLGLIPGKVVRIEDTDTEGNGHKVPHVGWNELQLPSLLLPSLQLPSEAGSDCWSGTILEGVPVNSRTYFVHSYTARPEFNQHRLADVYYGGHPISAAIRKGNIYGTQFHPEKSGDIGLAMIKNFIMLR